MTGTVIHLPGVVSAPERVAAVVPVAPVDFSFPLGKIERTCRWLHRRGVEVVGYGWHFFGGPRVRVKESYVLRMMLADEMQSRGHTSSSGLRIEHWEARDPSTGVLIEWDEERKEGAR